MRPVLLSPKSLALAIVLFFTLAVLVHYHLHQRHRSSDSSFSQMLYLPEGKYLKPVSFGYHILLSDFLYLWSIQYYTDLSIRPRIEYLPHTYDIITDLDPHYIDAYQTGALFLFYEGRNPQAGLRLLNKGFQKNPREWILPVEAGFYCMLNLRNRKLAAHYFELASKVPDAPSLTKRTLASLHFKMGEKELAYRIWKEVYETEEKPSIRRIAFQHMHDLQVLIDLDHLRKAIAQYRNKFQSYPLNLNQLVSSKFLQQVPLDPEGEAYEYNPQTGTIAYSQRLRLYRRYQ